MDSLTISIAVLAAAAVFCFFAGLITRNYSHVDRLWSILPPVYVLIWFTQYHDNPRYIIAAVLVLLWGARLTINFAVKGGYSFSREKGFTGEDYRWEYMRQAIPGRVLFELFNLFFISAYQLGLIFVFTLPLYYYGRISGRILPVEIILFCVHFVFLALETIADVQQFRFHKRKKALPYKDVPRYKAGFNTFGLWSISRHPNYVCEMGQWVVVYFYLVSASGKFHWSGLGAALLILLFAGSTRLAESISRAKYPLYRDWCRATPPWIPFVDMSFRIKHRKEFRKKLEDNAL